MSGEPLLHTADTPKWFADATHARLPGTTGAHGGGTHTMIVPEDPLAAAQRHHATQEPSTTYATPAGGDSPAPGDALAPSSTPMSTPSPTSTPPVAPLLPPKSFCAHVEAVTKRVTSFTLGKVAAFAWAAVLVKSVTTVAPATGDTVDAGSLVLAAIGFSLFVWGMLYALLYVVRAVAAFEMLRREVNRLLKRGGDPARTEAAAATGAATPDGVRAAPPEAGALVRSTLAAVRHITRQSTSLTVMVLETGLLRLGDTASFSIATVWYATLTAALPTIDIEGAAAAGAWIELAYLYAAFALLLVLVDAAVVHRVTNGIVSRTWGFGDIGALHKAFHHSELERDESVLTHADTAAAARARVNSIDYILTEAEKSVAWLFGFTLYGTLARTLASMDVEAHDAVAAAWVTFFVLSGGVSAAYALHQFVQSSTVTVKRPANAAAASGVDGGGAAVGAAVTQYRLPALPDWMAPNRNAAVAATDALRADARLGAGAGGAASATSVSAGHTSTGADSCSRGASSYWRKARTLFAASLTWACILCLNGALKQSINPDLKPTGSTTTGSENVWPDLIAAIAVFAGVVAVSVVVERVLAWVALSGVRAQLKEADPAMVGKRSYTRLLLVAATREAYLKATVKVMTEATSLLAALAVNQVFLDLVKGRTNSLGSSFLYAVAVTALTVTVDLRLARRAAMKVQADAAAADAKTASADGGAGAAASSGAAAPAADSALAKPAASSDSDAAADSVAALRAMPAADVKDPTTAKRAITVARADLADARAALLRKRTNLVNIANA